MYEQYEKTSLEKWLEELYREKGINKPEDLEVVHVANSFGININFMKNAPERAIWDEEHVMIFLNSNQDVETLREKFFHELCHPLRHYGDQTNMSSKIFRELQEIQANQFQLYAAIPFYMVQKLESVNLEHEMISQIQTVFKVSNKLAKKRFEQIKRRIFQAKSDTEHRKFMERFYPKAPPYSVETNAVLDKLQMILEKRGVKS